MILFRKGESYNDNGWASEKEGAYVDDAIILLRSRLAVFNLI
jgi:hypothetical protein